MVQLYAYEGNTRYELDLYKTDPIKINLQIEDIIDVSRVESAYTQSFRIPATQNNSRFFKWWYEMSTVDFDITKVVSAEIHSDGLLYMSGEIRLQSAYLNRDTNQIDLEVMFLGNVRDFATQVAEIYMNQLDLAELNHELTWKDDGVTNGTLEESWLGNLSNGAIRYILADRGYDFNDDGAILFTQGELVADKENHTHSVMKNNPSFPFKPTQFTPLIRIKEIVDAIFALTDYDYTNDSFFSDTSSYWTMVQDLYTEGLPGATAEIVFLDGNVEVGNSGSNLATGTVAKMHFPNEIVNNSLAWNQNNDWYIAQADELALDIRTTINFAWSGESDGGGPAQTPGPLTVTLYKTVNGVPTVINTRTKSANQGNMTYTYVYDSVLDPITYPPITLDKGEKVYIEYLFDGQTDRAAGNGTFATENAISLVNVAGLLKDDVLIIDFLKSILTKFRLVMAPSKLNPYKFVIKPWVDYIGSGDRLDWTYKLDGNYDVQVSPIFFEQTQDIEFKDVLDKDFINELYNKENNLIFGEHLYDGSNELLVGRREVTTAFASTPTNRVEEQPGSSNFIVPKFYVHGEDANATSSHYHVQHLPMRPQPRLLFWRGMQLLNNSDTWYYGLGANHIEMDTYPFASYFNHNINLNWSAVNRYIENNYPDVGISVYDTYWSDYIDSLYSKDARLYTAYFVLDSQDLRELSFNDIIFIDNNYYRVSKVYDAPLDGIASIKVDLIKILNY